MPNAVERYSFPGLEVLPNETEYKLYAFICQKHPTAQILYKQTPSCNSFGLIDYLIHSKVLPSSITEVDTDVAELGLLQGHLNIEWNENAGDRPKNRNGGFPARFEAANTRYVMGSSDPSKGASYLEPLNCTLRFEYEKVYMTFYRFTVRAGFDTNEVNFLVWKDHYTPHKGNALGSKLFDEVFRFERSLRDEVWVFDERWMKDSKMFAALKDTRKDDIILPQHLLESMTKDVETFFAGKESFKDARIAWKRGMLLLGPPGNGKTATIRALLQDHLDIPILYVKSFQTGRSGTPEKGVRNVFNKARNCAPCFLILEDLDSLVTDSIRSFVLNEIDGLTNNDGIILIASTNHPDKLDDAFLRRPSRFDRKYTFNCPSPEERARYLQHWFIDRLEVSLKIVEDTSLTTKIIESTEGWSFALLQELFVSFSMQSLRAKLQDGQKSKEDLQRSILEIVESLNIEQTQALQKEAEKSAKEDAKKADEEE
ncbi:P-loop containing nucleoside triphosphate hydrolase protein [Meira miltonrushii]|uniref:P-loop containing nucleoside triphosphate hydrolase protein n=1 Tax=Meira miltonrushii TaxID=1280837 RepID=A0A316V7M8_9BASI|nr:P-loop containing nucleoside triphosphate hydrolase protein [Meira miltonrushii]PWN33607.1 P-loop containing nucleoside triphosphate hydrolase protein [Meira miltonrushii]